jgi:drug/metabolite transporter (DMT)-like permease
VEWFCLSDSPPAMPHFSNVFGASAVLFASVFWAIGSLYARSAKLSESPLLATGMEMFTGGVALLLIATTVGEWHRLDIGAVSSRSALALAYLTLVGSAAFVAYAWLLRVAPTPLVSTYAYVNPLVAVLLGYFLAGEPMTTRTLFSASLIIARSSWSARLNDSDGLSGSIPI